MALPKVTPGNYNYGSYANPKQVRLADTSAIGQGIERMADKAVGALQRDDAERKKRAAEERARDFQRETATTAFERSMTKMERQSELGVESYEQKLGIQQEAKETAELRDIERRSTVINLEAKKRLASVLSAENLKQMDESLATIKNDPNLTDDEKFAQLTVLESQRKETLSAYNNMKSFESPLLESTADSALLTREARIIKGILDAKKSNTAIFNGIDPDAGGTYTIDYKNEKGGVEAIQLSSSEINDLLSNADKYVEVKHATGTSQADQQVMAQVLNIFEQAELRGDELYYKEGPNGTKVLDKELFKEKMIQNPMLLNAAAVNGKPIYRTMTSGGEYDPTNSQHAMMVLNEYIDASLRSLEATRPSLFQMPEKKPTGFQLPPDYEGLSDAKQKTILKRGLESKVKEGDISIIQDYFGEDLEVKDGKYILQDTEMSASRLIENYIEAAGNTWQSSTENLLRKKAEPEAPKTGGLPII